MNGMNLNNREYRMMMVAKQVAKTSDFHGAHVGCAVAIKKQVISVAANSEKTHSLQGVYNKFRNFEIENSPAKVHAEVHALSWLIGKKINWNKVELYVYREHKNGSPAMSKPCAACFNLIKRLGIKNIFYIDKNGDFIKEKIK